MSRLRSAHASVALEGFEVQEAADGLDALARIDRGLPDLIALDLMLPHVTGQAVLPEIAA